MTAPTPPIAPPPNAAAYGHALANLDDEIGRQAAYGWAVMHRRGLTAALHKKGLGPLGHTLSAVATVFTFGLYSIVWLIVASTRTRVRLVWADPWGQVTVR